MDKISPKNIKLAIIAEARKINRKEELYAQVQEIELELKTLNEGLGVVGGFGFAVPGDKSQDTKTGFAGESLVTSLSNIINLDDEMKDINEDTIDEMTKLKEEIEALKAENKTLKKSK